MVTPVDSSRDTTVEYILMQQELEIVVQNVIEH
jgi:hypothetical protein